jgi:hypothetical protein
VCRSCGGCCLWLQPVQYLQTPPFLTGSGIQSAGELRLSCLLSRYIVLMYAGFLCFGNMPQRMLRPCLTCRPGWMAQAVGCRKGRMHTRCHSVLSPHPNKHSDVTPSSFVSVQALWVGCRRHMHWRLLWGYKRWRPSSGVHSHRGESDKRGRLFAPVRLLDTGLARFYMPVC